ncbi:MAG TPA: TolC family protein [Gemmatimonadaceae bacterium]|nr:TolC family protein [Gemmatimonadaceae bacterium]
MTSMMRRAVRRGRATIRTALATLALAGPCALAPAAAARAQSTAPPRLLLGDLYRDARRESPRAEAARALARAAEARVSSTRLPPDPQLQLGFMNYTLPGLEPMDPLGMTQLQLMQMLPVAGKLGLSARAADARASAAAARAGDAVWEVRNQAAMAFYELYQTDQGLDVARQTLRLLQDIASTAESMYRVGAGRQADVLRAQVEIARMTEDTIRMRAMRTAMAARLNALLDRAPESGVPSPALPAFPATIPSLDSLQRLARAYRPMLAAGERDVDAARADERLARREIWPDLALGVQYGQRSGEMGVERMGSLMVGASVPIFARGRQLRMREEAAAMRQMALADLAAMAADTRGRIGEAYADLERARRLAALYRTTVIPQSEAAAASALSSYRVGGVDFMTLLDDRMTVTRYRTELFTLEADEGKAWAELEMLGGRELFDPNTIVRATADGGAR